MKDSLVSRNREFLAALFAEHSDIGIIVGEEHDIDKIAASLSLYLSFVSNQKNTQIISRKEPIVELSHLVGIDKIRDQFRGGTKVLTVVFPYREGEIEKVSYNIEGDSLNINLFAAGSSITFEEGNVRYLRKGSLPLLLIAVGVPSFDEITDMVSLDSSCKVINIDNNPANSFYGDLALVDSTFSSISEIVSALISDLALPVDSDIAQNLMEGLVFATSNFSSHSASLHAFEAASFLLRNGAVRKGDTRHHRYEARESRHEMPKDTFIASLEKKVVEQPRIESFQRDKVARQQVQRDKLEEDLNGAEEVPQDWFVPKVFKGSASHDDEKTGPGR